MQIQISWLLQKPTDLDLHCLLRQGMSCSARKALIYLFVWKYHEQPRVTLTGPVSSFVMCMLTITTLLAYWAEDKLMIFFLFSPENRIRHFMQIVSKDTLHKMLNPVFWENKTNISICRLLKVLPRGLSVKYTFTWAWSVCHNNSILVLIIIIIL